MKRVEFDTTIKGGLPVRVVARLCPPEPDIGIYDWQADPVLFWPGGGFMNIEIPPRDWERIITQCIEEGAHQ